MALRLTPSGNSQEAAAALALAQQAVTDAKAADEKAANARQMVLNDRERNALSLDELRAAAAQLPTTQQAAAEAHLAFQQQIDMLREMVNADATENDATQAQVDALVQQVATIQLTPGPAGKDGKDGAPGSAGSNGADGKSAYQLARDAGYGGTQAQWLASLKGAEGAPGAKGADGQSIKGDKGDAGTPADMTRVAALEAAVATLNALKVRVAFGSAALSGSLLGGATQNVVIGLDKNMGSATYSVGYSMTGGTSLLGQLVIGGIVAQTATSVTVQVRNTGLTSLANLSAAVVYVVAAREA